MQVMKNPQLPGGGGDECPSPVRAARKVWELREQMSAQATEHRRVSSAVHIEFMTIDGAAADVYTYMYIIHILENNIQLPLQRLCPGCRMR